MSKSPDAFRTISEVAEVLDTPAHVLRFWESRFSQVKPVKRAGGRRYYRPSDMALLAGIRKLLHDDGMTIKGVQKVLREKGVKHVSALGGDTTTLFDEDIGAMPDPQNAKIAGSDTPEISPEASVVPFRASATASEDDTQGATAQPPEQPAAPDTQQFDWINTKADDAAEAPVTSPPEEDSLASYALPFAEALTEDSTATTPAPSGTGPDDAAKPPDPLPDTASAEDSLADYVRPFAEAVLKDSALSDPEDQPDLAAPQQDISAKTADASMAPQDAPPTADAIPHETSEPRAKALVLPELPTDPDLAKPTPRPGRMPPVVGLSRLTPAQATDLAPVVARLRGMLDGYAGKAG